jgi:single-strand DNA-binding protein
MTGWQQVIIVGNLGRDAEMRYLQSGQGVCSFNVAVSESWTDRQTNERREKTTWFRCSAWGQIGENVHQYLTKGKQVMVIGTVEARAYTDNAGQPAASLELRVRDIRLLGQRADGDRQGDMGDYRPAPDNLGDIPF